VFLDVLMRGREIRDPRSVFRAVISGTSVVEVVVVVVVSALKLLPLTGENGGLRAKLLSFATGGKLLEERRGVGVVLTDVGVVIVAVAQGDI